MLDKIEDIEVTWARRQESIRGILKHLRVMVETAQLHSHLAERHCGISATHLWALWELHRAPGLRAIDLAKAMAIQAPMAKTMLHDLQAQGLVHGISAVGGQNSVRMSLTEAGRQRIGLFPGAPQGVVAAAVENLDDDRLDHLRLALQTLLEAMPHADGKAAFAPLGDCIRDIGDARPTPAAARLGA